MPIICLSLFAFDIGFTHSIDTFVTGIKQTFTGESQDSTTTTVVKATATQLGATPHDAQRIAGIAEICLGGTTTFVNATISSPIVVASRVSKVEQQRALLEQLEKRMPHNVKGIVDVIVVPNGFKPFVFTGRSSRDIGNGALKAACDACAPVLKSLEIQASHEAMNFLMKWLTR